MLEVPILDSLHVMALEDDLLWIIGGCSIH